jgi:hypothetical protein
LEFEDFPLGYEARPVTSPLGLEYLWGQRENKDGESGTAERLLFSSKFDF